MVEHKADAKVPDLLELEVHEPLGGGGVVPLGHVVVAVGVGRGRAHLYVVDASRALELVMRVTEIIWVFKFHLERGC